MLFIPALISCSLTSKLVISGLIPLFLVLFSYFNNFQFKKNSIKTTIYTLIIFGIAMLSHSFIITDLPAGNGPHVMGLSMMYLIACLWYYEQNKFMPILISFICFLSILFSGNNSQFEENNLYYYIVYSSIPLFIIFLLLKSSKKISKINIITIFTSIILVSLLTLSFNKGLFALEKKLNQELMDWISSKDSPSSSVGLSSDFEIKSHVNLKLSNNPVMIVYSDKKIDYLKAQVFNVYQNSKWGNISKKKVEAYNFEINKKKYSSFDFITAKDLEKEDILSEGKLEFIQKKDSFIPLPYYAKAFKVNKDNELNNFYTLENKNNLSNFYFYGNDNYLFKSNKRLVRESLLLDNYLKDILEKKSLEITKGAKNNIEKAKLIQQFFQNNFKYSLDVSFNPNKEPIIDFIFNKKVGFCSHFSSAMVLMLRSLNIPSNIIGGYLTQEYDNYIKGYIVREKDAHAWVEVYDEKNNLWVKFDPTPIQQMFNQTNLGLSFFDKLELYFKTYKNKSNEIFTLEFLIKAIFVVVIVLIFLIIILSVLKIFKKERKLDIYDISKDIQITSNKINKILSNIEFKYNENMTYSEIKENIELSEIEKDLKDNLKRLLSMYEELRYGNKNENISNINEIISKIDSIILIKRK